jgi:hypothetical protein
VELRQFVRRRFDEIDKTLVPLHVRREQLLAEVHAVDAQIANLQPELEELRRVAETLALDLVSSSDHPRSKDGDTTIKQAIRLTLNLRPNGLNSTDLHAEASNDFFDGKLDRTSFSPQLSRMRRDGEVDLNDSIWTLTDYGRLMMQPRSRGRVSHDRKENEPHDGGTSHGSDTVSVFD